MRSRSRTPAPAPPSGRGGDRPAPAPAAAPRGEGDHPAQRRVLAVLTIAQILSGAALAAGFTIGPVLAEAMLGSTSLAGVPSALFAAGAALGALAIGRISRSRGRRPGLVAGYATGAVGSLGTVAATAWENVPLLLAALLVYGVGTASIMQARFAGADLAASARRARAVGTVLLATSAGAVAGPNLVGVTGEFAESHGIPSVGGPFLLAFAGFAAAALVLGTMLRPDPLLTARTAAAEPDPAAAPDPATTPPEAAGDSPDGTGTTAPGVRATLATGVTLMVLAQLVMISVMTMTPIHMTDHGHSAGAAGLVIGLHLGAMYLMSPVSGVLADRVGRRTTAVLSVVVLVGSALLAALLPAHSASALSAALILLGVGWNLAFVSGSAMVTDALPPSAWARGQSLTDVGILVVGAGGGLLSGVIMAAGGFPLLALGGAILLLIPLPPLLLGTVLPRTSADAAAAKEPRGTVSPTPES
ncbi:MFS transporter [Streptomyces sp. NPDC020875]|uniref:MFS transporter n=1 Tax=Streptomyces sp. NPDC020875 TaxID=3154898 RepID=UPI003410E95F